MADLEIIGVPMSNYVRSVRMLCEEKGVAYKLNPAFPHTPDVLAISPAGQVPCMRHGDVAVFESKGIATYIDKAFPGPKFIPEDAVGAAMCEQWVSYGNVKVDRWIMRELVVRLVFADKEKGPDMAKIEAAVPEIAKIAKALDDALARSTYLAGDSLTFADMNVLPMIDYGLMFPQSKAVLEGHANLMAYHARLTARPSFRDTAPPPRG